MSMHRNILGDEHPQFGRGTQSWLTGTSLLAYQAATQYIMGLRPATLAWKSALFPTRGRLSGATRVRGTIYQVVVETRRARLHGRAASEH